MDTPRPSGTTTGTQLVAIYRTESAARTARDKLIAEAIPESDIHMITPHAREPEGAHRGVWGHMRGLFGARGHEVHEHEEELHAYAESVRRGHTVLVVRARPELEQRIAIILEDSGPINLDEQTADWRATGWDGSYTDRAAEEAAMPATAVVTPAGPLTEPVQAPRESDEAALGRAKAELNALQDTRPEPLPHAESVARTDRATEAEAARIEPVTPPVSPMTFAPMAERSGPEAETARIPVVEEQVRVGKRQRDAGSVRVRSYVIERPVEQQVTLHEERVHLERHPADRAATASDGDAFRERTIEVSVTSEEPVVHKEARVVEEVEIRKEGTERVETVHDTARRTEVEVEDDRHPKTRQP